MNPHELMPDGLLEALTRPDPEYDEAVWDMMSPEQQRDCMRCGERPPHKAPATWIAPASIMESERGFIFIEAARGEAEYAKFLYGGTVQDGHIFSELQSDLWFEIASDASANRNRRPSELGATTMKNDSMRELARVRTCDVRVDDNFPYFDVLFDFGGSEQGLGSYFPYAALIVCFLRAVGASSMRDAVGKPCWVTHSRSNVSKVEPLMPGEGTTLDMAAMRAWLRDRIPPLSADDLYKAGTPILEQETETGGIAP